MLGWPLGLRRRGRGGGLGQDGTLRGQSPNKTLFTQPAGRDLACGLQFKSLTQRQGPEGTITCLCPRRVTVRLGFQASVTT